MSERRSHWDDDLIDAVRDAVDIEWDGIWRLTEDSILAVIAAVEDWVLENYQGGEYDNPVEFTPEEAAIARVRQLHRTGPGAPTPGGSICWCCWNPWPCLTIRALDGDSDG